jgi:CTP:molybdopterin cytidylyltransferase MocA
MTKSHDDVAAIILAAGRSSRMGAFKALLPFGPKTVIKSCIDAMRDAGVQTVIVVVGADRAADVQEHLQDSNVVFAVNPDAGSEMSASVSLGVSVVPDKIKAVLILPVDHAAVPAEAISTVIDEWKKGAVLVKPVIGERGGHPVLIDLRFRNELLNLDPAQGLRGLFDAHESQVARVPVHSNYVACDMDTWDDYRALHEDLFGEPPPEKAR